MASEFMDHHRIAQMRCTLGISLNIQDAVVVCTERIFGANGSRGHRTKTGRQWLVLREL